MAADSGSEVSRPDRPDLVPRVTAGSFRRNHVRRATNPAQVGPMCIDFDTEAPMTSKTLELGDLFTREEALAAGMTARGLYSLRDSGELVVLGRGLYRRADAPPADFNLIEIAERAPNATLCLETALARHGLLDVIPAAIDIAIPRGAHRPQLHSPVRLHYFQAATFDIGRDTIDVGARSPLGLYSAERSLIDFIRLRHAQGADQAWEALRRWLALPGRNPGRLLRLAKSFRGAEAPLREALEILL